MEQYIPKSALVEEIEKRIEETKGMQPKFDQFWAGQVSAFKGVLKILDTLEVKEVNLEKELNKLDSTLYDMDGVAIDDNTDSSETRYITVEDVKDIARHFFELGLSVSNKAQKEVQEEPYVMSDTGRYTTTTK